MQTWLITELSRSREYQLAVVLAVIECVYEEVFNIFVDFYVNLSVRLRDTLVLKNS